ncbi:MAG TPA: hypothetical protein VN256_10590 [Pyrinomonadaceae bacterium]|nr:hypothetical protein [Pyrinomonadaceae bacterium]
MPRTIRHGSIVAALVLAASLVACFLARPALSANQSNPQDAGQQESPRPEAQRPQEGRSPLAQSPVLEEFKRWAEQFKLGGTTAASEQEGRELARQRREVMARLVEEDPRSAVEQAVPARVRERLPEEIRREVEQEVSGYGDYLVLIYDEADPQTGEFVRSRTERKVVLDGKTYRASVYGRKLGMTTKLNVPLRGVVMGDVIALAESPVRILSDEERGAASTGRGIDAEVGGRVLHFETREELDRFEEELKKHEMTINPGRSGKSKEAEGAAAADSEAQAPVSGATSTSAWTQGAKTVLMIRVDFSDMPGEPVDANGKTLTVASAQALLNSEANDFYKANSYNKTSIAGTVTKVLRMPLTAKTYGDRDDPFQLMEDARAAARAAGYDTNNFNLDIVVFKRITAFAWAGLGYIGAKGSWLNGFFTIRETSHELGHNFGLNHANLWKTTDGTVTGRGASQEYANPFDAMGGGRTTVTHHFSTWYKTLMGWLPNTGVQTVTAAGTYRLQPHDFINSAGRRALKIPRDWNSFYWVEFRQAITEYPAVAGGAVVFWGYTENTKSNLLDMTPKSTAGADDSPLAVGQSFTDSTNGIKITVVGKTSTTPAQLDVKVTYTTNLDRLVVNPPTIVGGGTINCAVTLNAPAPMMGAEIKLADNVAATTVPATVFIPQGQRMVSFQIKTAQVAAAQAGTLTASFRGVSRTSPLTVEPLAVSSLTLSRSAVGGGANVTATVTLNGVAPSSGAGVTLSDDIPSATTPASVTVPSGAKTRTFTVTTTAVATSESGTVTASLGGVTKSAALKVDPITLVSFTVLPASAAGGAKITGTLALNGPAPPEGLAVNLSDNIPATTLPAQVTIPAGATSKTFSITSSRVDANQSGTVTARSGAVTKTAPLTIRPPALNALKLNPASVAGGKDVTGTVSLDGPAPPSGAIITISDNLASATTTPSVTIPAGAVSASFTISTVVVDAKQTGAVTASRNGVTKTAALIVRPASIQSVTVSPNSIRGGSSATGTVVLETTFASDVVVTLSDNLPATAIPESVTVPAGSMSATFQVATTYALPSQQGTLTATAGTESRSVSLSVVNTQSQLLGNTSFESGAFPWVIYPGGESKVIYHSTDGEAYSGQYMAFLGGYTTTPSEYFYQEVTIPSDAISADLTFHLRLYTQEGNWNAPNDTMEVQIQDGNGQVLATVAAYSNLDTPVWYERKVVDLSAYKGQTIRVYFLGKSNQDSLQTFFYVDDVTLDVIR